MINKIYGLLYLSIMLKEQWFYELVHLSRQFLQLYLSFQLQIFTYICQGKGKAIPLQA